MKKLLSAAALFTSFFLFGGDAHSQDVTPQRVRTENFGIVGYRGVAPKARKHQDCCATPRRAKKLRTVEICRRAFTKTEKHCCGIVMRGNYIRVVYKSYYSDGSEVICTKEYRS